MADRHKYEFLDNNGLFKVFAHRGGRWPGIPENSMQAFETAYREAQQRGIKSYVEIDVILTADDQVIVYHGAKNKAHEKKKGVPERKKLQNMTYRAIQNDYSELQIPTLASILSSYPDMRLNVDLKSQEVVKPFADLIKQYQAVSRICISGYWFKSRTRPAADLLGGSDKVCTAAGSFGSTVVLSRFISYLKFTNVACVQLPFRLQDLQEESDRSLAEPQATSHRLVTTEIVERIHALGLDVHLWTLNDVPAMDEALQLSVDGIMSDEIVTLHDRIQYRRISRQEIA